MNITSYKEAKDLFLSMDYSIEDYFKTNNYVLEYAYCKLLKGDAETAKNEFLKILNYDTRANWGYKLTQFIDGYVMNVPSYFQIRNFLEIDLNLLIKSKLPDFVENVINGADIFYSINPESYKFIARVMLYNNFDEIAFYYLKKVQIALHEENLDLLYKPHLCSCFLPFLLNR